MAIFADTFFYLALLNPADASHDKARRLGDLVTEPVVTTAWIVTELADGLSTPPQRATFLELLDFLEHDPQTSIVGVDEQLYGEGLRLYRDRPDKAWSLTDCISFIVMRRQNIASVLTGDRHFEQAGFTAMLR